MGSGVHLVWVFRWHPNVSPYVYCNPILKYEFRGFGGSSFVVTYQLKSLQNPVHLIRYDTPCYQLKDGTRQWLLDQAVFPHLENSKPLDYPTVICCGHTTGRTLSIEKHSSIVRQRNTKTHKHTCTSLLACEPTFHYFSWRRRELSYSCYNQALV